MRNRLGRKRKSGRRHPNGQLVQRRPDDRLLAAQQPHRRWLPEADRLSHKAENPLDAYTLVRGLDGAPLVSEEQAEAGRLYVVALGQYRAVCGSPRGTAGTGKGYDCNVDLCRSDDERYCECTARTKRYMGMYEALAAAGRKATMVVNRVAVQRMACLPGEFDALRTGLDAIAKHIGLKRER